MIILMLLSYERVSDEDMKNDQFELYGNDFFCIQCFCEI